MKYCFLTGAPGSKWSSVAKNIYWSDDFDHSDYSDARTYYNNVDNKTNLLHFGSYFDPQMEFGSFFDKISEYSIEEIEEELQKPFTNGNIKLIKSHMLSLNLNFISQNFSNSAIVCVLRNEQLCLNWWMKAGGFDITYPNYSFYKNSDIMYNWINLQNRAIKEFVANNNCTEVKNNYELCDKLGISYPPIEHKQNYVEDAITVYVHQNAA